VAWEIRVTDTALPDLLQFEDPQEALNGVFDWVTNGPPCDRKRGVGPAVIYEDYLENGVKVQYFIGVQPHAYVAIVRIRPPIIQPPS
jgi:hypothetical protein